MYFNSKVSNAPARTVPGDWYPGTLPENAALDASAYVETAFSFVCHRSEQRDSVRIGRGASIYKSTMFDLGRSGKVSIGAYALIHGARLICDDEIEIGDYTLVSWNVVLMDSYRFDSSPAIRRAQLAQLAEGGDWLSLSRAKARPIRVGGKVWIGFGSCILPGVTIGEGAIVGARSVVTQDVPPYTIVAGNPAQVVRQIIGETSANGI
jgi:acetyltransferase-like isoleucine patch superfamily enzyme